MLQYAQYMFKFRSIKSANRLFGEHFNLQADMRADIRIRASISAHVPWNVIDNADITESKWPTCSWRFRHSLHQSRIKVTRKVHKDMKIGSKEWEKNGEDVQKRSYEPKDDVRYETGNKEERGKLINLGNFLILL